MIRISYNNFQDLWERGTYSFKKLMMMLLFSMLSLIEILGAFCSVPFFKVVYNTLACLREATVVALNDDWQKQ